MKTINEKVKEYIAEESFFWISSIFPRRSLVFGFSVVNVGFFFFFFGYYLNWIKFINWKRNWTWVSGCFVGVGVILVVEVTGVGFDMDVFEVIEGVELGVGFEIGFEIGFSEEEGGGEDP